MKMEVLNLSAEEKRIILLFDNSELSPEDEKVDEVVKLICDAVGTNSKQGDGIIFVWDLVSATRIEMTNPG